MTWGVYKETEHATELLDEFASVAAASSECARLRRLEWDGTVSYYVQDTDVADEEVAAHG